MHIRIIIIRNIYKFSIYEGEAYSYVNKYTKRMVYNSNDGPVTYINFVLIYSTVLGQIIKDVLYNLETVTNLNRLFIFFPPVRIIITIWDTDSRLGDYIGLVVVGSTTSLFFSICTN